MDAKAEELHRAARLGDTTLLLKALEACPDAINHQDARLGWTPLYRAVICGHHEAARILLKRGADPNLCTRAGDSPLHLAADDGNIKLVRGLLEAKADPNARQSEGETPLHKAAAKGHHRVCWLLLKHRADPDLRNFIAQRSSLHVAVALNRKKVVQLFLTYDADPNLRDKAGNSAFDLAPTQEMRDTLDGVSQGSPESASSDISGAASPLPPLLSEVSVESPQSVKISELMEAIANIPLISQENVFTVEEDEAVMEGISEFSEAPEEERQLTPIHTAAIEPESEQTEGSIAAPLQRSFSFGADPKKSSMYSWLVRVRLEMLFDPLLAAGFDDIASLRDQMNSSLPLDLEGLKNIGIAKAGYRVRLLACLEEEARGRFRGRHKAAENKDFAVFQCCRQTSSSPSLIFLPNLYQWLEQLHLQHIASGFVNSGYDDLEHLLALMHTRYPITDQVLRDDVKVVKLGHRQRLLVRLEEDSMKVDSMLRPRSAEPLALEREVTLSSCSACIIS